MSLLDSINAFVGDEALEDSTPNFHPYTAEFSAEEEVP
jgi:hypothetical protein